MVIDIDTVMSIEEKAKAYDEAIRKIQEIIIMDNAPVTPKEIGEYLFPKLKESDDEKIRKYLIDVVRDYVTGSEYEGCIAWLEKQGENKFEQCIQDGDNIVTNKDGTHFNVSQLERVSQKVTNTKETAKKFLKSAGIMNKNGELADEYRLEKQNEQNPTDKFEPKFKVGDWITDGYLYYKITDVLEDRYIVDRKFAKERCAILFKFEHYYHLWTLKDAKDGDVLAFDNDNIVIFKDLYNYTSFHSYCHIEDGIFDFSTDGLPDWWEDEGFKPATKEQSNILFQKMKEAGYEWDADKKELKITYWSKHIKYKSNSPSIFTKESTWNEEDTFKVQRICKYLDEAKKYYADITEVRECIDWIKSLEERLKGKNEKVITKEEKDLLLKDLEWCDMETNECHCYNCELFDSKNNVCKCIDLCKRPKNTYKGFYIK